jgi:hypothetical protein
VVQPSHPRPKWTAEPRRVLLLPSPAPLQPASLSLSLSLTAPSWIPGSSSRVYMAVRPWPSYHYWMLDASQQARMGAACQSPEPCTLLPSLPGMCSAPPLCDNATATATASSSTARHVCHAACSRRVHSDCWSTFLEPLTRTHVACGRRCHHTTHVLHTVHGQHVLNIIRTLFQIYKFFLYRIMHVKIYQVSLDLYNKTNSAYFYTERNGSWSSEISPCFG